MTYGPGNVPMNRGKGTAIKWLRDHVSYAGDGCLTWPFARNPGKGYGVLAYNGETHYAHRFMCELVRGPAPTPKHQAGHLCGLGHEGCVHPLHIVWKTNTENQLDRITHGTTTKNPPGRRKLTFAQIAEARSLKGRETQDSLARRFGVKPGCIEYWQRHDRDPAPLSTSPSAVQRRRKRALEKQSI